VKDFRLPLVVNDRRQGRQHTVARVDLGVELPAKFKGTHMSRFIEALEGWCEELSYQSIKNLLSDVKNRLAANKAYAVFRFTYFITKKAPVSGAESIIGYECCLTGEMRAGEEKPHFRLQVDAPVMTVCPCSKAISREGAHSQRALVRLTMEMKGFAWIEEFVELAERAGSSPVYPLLKREDEKFVTEGSFATPRFVEDVVRLAARELAAHPQVANYKVEVESMESIHDHNAYACIEG
jgi:GTP cyclohydrolase I